VSEIARLNPEHATEVAEASLLSRARSGDREATELLVRRYLRDVYDLTARVLSDRFRGESSFKTWLLRIALNSARSIGRRKGRRREVALELVEETPAESTDAVERIGMASEAKKMEALLQKLPEKQRLSVTLRLQQGLSYEEIAAALDCSEGAARVNYHLGLKRLREWAT
jgi:RNA polymerase sigma-70 factor (ECF subfamily)